MLIGIERTHSLHPHQFDSPNFLAPMFANRRQAAILRTPQLTDPFMKRLGKALLAMFVVVLVAAIWMFWPVRLQVATLPQSIALPAANPPPSLVVYALPTGAMHSQSMFAYRGGPIGEARDFTMTAYLVRHPRGDLLIDTGLGSQVDEQFAALPLLMRATSTYSAGQTAAKQLIAAGIDPGSLAGILLTHAHWDHVSGLPDIPDVPVMLPQEEAQFVASDAEMAALARSMTDVDLEPFEYAEVPYLGYQRSYDVWGDGSVVVVAAGGHTPGSAIVFVALPDQTRYVFVGDIVWQMEGLELPAERPWLSRQLVDLDAAQVRSQISHLAALKRRFPELIMVPAHDSRPASSIPLLSVSATQN